MSLWSALRKGLHSVALLRPILKILGVKGGTVADKAAEAAAVADSALPQSPEVVDPKK